MGKPIKYSDSTLQRKEEELQAQDKKISLTKDKIKLDSDRITLDQNQLARYKQDIKAEEELLRVFRRKGEKQSSIIDKDQETLQKDEQNLQILFYQRGEIQKEIDNPYYKGDKDTDSNADTAEGSSDDDAAIIGSNSTDITGENSTSINGTSTDDVVTESNSTIKGDSTGNSTNPEDISRGKEREGQGGPEDGNNSTTPMPVIGEDGGNSTNATVIPSDTEENCKPTIYNAYCSKTFKRVKEKVKGGDKNAKASGGLRGAWNAVEEELGRKPSLVKHVAPVAQTPPAPSKPTAPSVVPVGPTTHTTPTTTITPVRPAAATPAATNPAATPARATSAGATHSTATPVGATHSTATPVGATHSIATPVGATSTVHPTVPSAHAQPARPAPPSIKSPKAVITEDKTV